MARSSLSQLVLAAVALLLLAVLSAGSSVGGRLAAQEASGAKRATENRATKNAGQTKSAGQSKSAAPAKNEGQTKNESTSKNATRTDDVNGASAADTSKESAGKAAAKAKAGATKPNAGKGAAANVDATKTAAAVGVTPEREAAVMKFVEQHHPELGSLLLRLKDGDRKEYDRAVRDLFRVSERLAQTHERDQSRYQLELRAWQVQSRIDLLTARMRMSGGDELKNQLRQTLLEQHEIKQQLLQFERDRVAERLQKLDDQLRGIEKSRDDVVEKQLRLLSGEKKK